jgi:Transmembrane domain of unknown function (DUF3566)
VSPSKAASSSDRPGKSGAVGTEAPDDDQTKPLKVAAAPAQSAAPAEKDGGEQRSVPLNKRAEEPSRSERDRREAVEADAPTSAFAPVATAPGYGALGSPSSSSGGYSGVGGYTGPNPQPSPPAGPPQVTPVSRPSVAARRARLKVSHLGPLSVLRVSLTFSLCMFIVLLVAVAALWGVLDSSGVFKSIIKAATTLTNDNNQSGVAPWLSFGRVMLITVVLGAANVIAFTLLSTIGALLYNLCSDFVGGVEVTLVER